MCAALAHPAAADMGRAPVGPPGTYVSLEGGYLLQDIDDITGHGIVSTSGGPISDVGVSPDDGWFAGGTIGYNGSSLFGPMERGELYLLYGSTEDERNDTAPPLADIVLKAVDGSPLVTTGGLKGHTSVELQTWEGGFRLEGDNPVSSTTTVTWSFAPFVRNMDEDTNTVVSGCCELTRTADVETWLYGVNFAAEPEVWVSSGIAVVGRFGLGIYGYDADGKFVSSASLDPDTFAARVSDDDSGVGFRGQLGLGLKFRLSSTTNIEAFGEADYFSDVGTAHMPDNKPANGDVARVDTDEFWELRSGLRLNFGFGPPN
jgi:hypothetical protein